MEYKSDEDVRNMAGSSCVDLNSMNIVRLWERYCRDEIIKSPRRLLNSDKDGMGNASPDIEAILHFWSYSQIQSVARTIRYFLG